VCVHARVLASLLEAWHHPYLVYLVYDD